MIPNAEAKAGQMAFLDDIEKRVGEIFSAQKSEVEQTLIEKINREKEDAQKRIEVVNQEFAQVRGYLDEHKTVMAELEATEEHLRQQIRGHFERAVNYQKMMENAAGLAGDELERIGGLNQELERVRVRAQEEYESLKTRLSGYAGIVAQIPAPAGQTASDIDWSQEMDKLRRVRDLLASLRHDEIVPSAAGAVDSNDAVDAAAPADNTDNALAAAEAAAAAAEAEALATAPVGEEAAELAASLGLVDAADDSIRDDIDFTETDPAWSEIPGATNETAAAAPEPSADRSHGLGFDLGTATAAAPADAPDAGESNPAEAALARYRRTEPVNNGIEIGFFSAETGAVLDAASFVSAVGKIVDAAGDLHTQLTKTESVKDLFLLKQEILNQQEILRKVFFRVVRFCDKEGGLLPEALGEIMTAQGMKDLIERLTMANWSDPSDFRPFLKELRAIKRAFEIRMAASPAYFKSVLNQVEGRDS
jgi:hypothetical protein